MRLSPWLVVVACLAIRVELAPPVTPPPIRGAVAGQLPLGRRALHRADARPEIVGCTLRREPAVLLAPLERLEHDAPDDRLELLDELAHAECYLHRSRCTHPE